MIEIQNLTFGYSKNKILFDDLNLSLNPGHIYGLLGKNGAGKSTLIKNIAGVAFPQKGKCRINGVDTFRRLPATLGNLFLIPEEIYLPSISIERFVNNTAVFYPKFDLLQFEGYLKEFDLNSGANISSLSYGQQKKVMIAFALATNTEVLIMDEPTNGLDIPSKVQFRKIVSGSLSEGRCILISTHQVRDLDNLIDSLIVINDRRIILDAVVDDIGDRLTFSVVNSPDIPGILYYEPIPKGYFAISANEGGQPTRVDLELLFNALTETNEKITEQLKIATYE